MNKENECLKQILRDPTHPRKFTFSRPKDQSFFTATWVYVRKKKIER